MEESFTLIDSSLAGVGKSEDRSNLSARLLTIDIQKVTGQNGQPGEAAASPAPPPIPLRPDLRVRLRQLAEQTASIIHADLGMAPAKPVNSAPRSLLSDTDDEEEPRMLTASEIRPLVEQLHAEARAQLMDAYLNTADQLRIDRIFRSLGDIISALRGAETASVALRLLRQQSHPIAAAVNFEGEQVIHEIVRQTGTLTMKTAQALSQAGSSNSAIDAATAIRGVRTLFADGDRLFHQSPESRIAREMHFGPVEYRRRVCRAALWSLILCAESMARVAARFAMTDEQQANLLSPRVRDNYSKKPNFLSQ